jgi:osmotically-inducible protein OsmY
MDPALSGDVDDVATNLALDAAPLGTRELGFAAAVLDPFRDAWLVARARLALLVACGRDVAEVGVEANRGRIVLSGEVATMAMRDEAEKSVRELPDIVGVSNLIRVRGARLQSRGGTDDELGKAVTAHLARVCRRTGIQVAGVYDGVVTLAGTARHAAERLAAFEAAIHTRGVRRVVSDVVVESSSPIAIGLGTDADAA